MPCTALTLGELAGPGGDLLAAALSLAASAALAPAASAAAGATSGAWLIPSSSITYGCVSWRRAFLARALSTVRCQRSMSSRMERSRGRGLLPPPCFQRSCWGGCGAGCGAAAAAQPKRVQQL